MITAGQAIDSSPQRIETYRCCLATLDRASYEQRRFLPAALLEHVLYVELLSRVLRRFAG